MRLITVTMGCMMTTMMMVVMTGLSIPILLLKGMLQTMMVVLMMVRVLI